MAGELTCFLWPNRIDLYLEILISFECKFIWRFLKRMGLHLYLPEIAPGSSCVFLSLFVFGGLGVPIVLKLKYSIVYSRVTRHVARFLSKTRL